MLELEDDFVTYKFQKPLTFREFVSVKKHNWKPRKTSHLLGSIHNLSRGWAMMISLFFPFFFLKPPLIISGFSFLTPPQEMLIY